MNTTKITRADLNERNEYKASASLAVEGHLEIEEGLGCVRFAGSLSASGHIYAKAGSGIEAGLGIEAGWSVRCKAVLSSGLRIFAGLCNWRLPTEDEMLVETAEKA